jgi:small subunit ribosomal protein S16
MAVKLRMTRMGRRHRPFFRINAVESRTPRDGKVLEKLGHYDPIEKDPAKQIVLKRERVEYWLDKGAIPSDTVSQILLRQGIDHKYAKQTAARRARAKALVRAKGKPFTKAERIALQKQAEQAEEKAKAKAVEEKPKAEAKAEPKVKTEEKAKEKPKAAEEKTEAQIDVKLELKAEQAKAKAAEQPTEIKPEPEIEVEVAQEKAEDKTIPAGGKPATKEESKTDEIEPEAKQE